MGGARGTAITSHRSWPVSGDVEGQPEERVGSHNQKPDKRDLFGNMLCFTEAALFHIFMKLFINCQLLTCILFEFLY